MEHSQERTRNARDVVLGTLKRRVTIEKRLSIQENIWIFVIQINIALEKDIRSRGEQNWDDTGQSCKNLSVFIGCVAPLQSDRLHTEATVKYMEELMSVDIYLQNRVATEEELTEHLQLFYLEYPVPAT